MKQKITPQEMSEILRPHKYEWIALLLSKDRKSGRSAVAWYHQVDESLFIVIPLNEDGSLDEEVVEMVLEGL